MTDSVEIDGSVTRTERIKRASKQRRAQHKAQLRLEILDAARSLFQEHGYEQFSMRQVAERIGYSPTTIYLHFRDKDDLLFHICIEGFRRFGTALQRAYDSTSDAVDRLIRLGRAYLEFGLANPLDYRVMFMLRPEFSRRQPPPGIERPLDSFGLLVSGVEHAIQADALPPREPLQHAGALWAMVHGIVALRLNETYDDAEAFHLFDLVMPAYFRGMTAAAGD